MHWSIFIFFFIYAYEFFYEGPYIDVLAPTSHCVMLAISKLFSGISEYYCLLLQVQNTNEHEDLQMLVILSRPPVKVYVICSHILFLTGY